MKTVYSVLIVDDNPDDIEITDYYLGESGRYRHVFSVSDGQEALELFRNYEQSRKALPEKFPPMLVILDINMPRMNGFEFLDAYSRLGRDAEDPAIIVMLTSSQYAKDVQRADQNGLVKDYLVKPFSREHADKLADSFGRQ